MTEDPTAIIAAVADVLYIPAERAITLDCVQVILDAARRGVTHPATLSAPEIQSICRSLIVHFAQMGIG